MSIEKKEAKTSKEAMKFLENLALNEQDFIFRGQQNRGDRLSTTLDRMIGMHSDKLVKDLLRRFEIALAKIGIFPFEKASRLDWLEYARHYGVPLPVLDFTYSPYVALFFAFNGLEDILSDQDSFVTVYILNTRNLAIGWSKLMGIEFDDNLYAKFKTAKEDQFDEEFATNILQLIPFPGKKNRRMMRQMGLLLYDTLDYASLGFDDMEDFIESIDESSFADKSPTLTKLYIHKQAATEIYERLELMNITGSQLFSDEHGAAMDVFNSYHYNSKIQFRDLDNR